MKKNSVRRRKPVEIYFVLYLSAFVLLISKIPDKNNENLMAQKNFDVPFTIKAEKPMLTCRIFIDSLGNRRTEIDSVNSIWDVGNVEDVHYEFLVEDQSLKHSIRISNKENKYFKFIEDSENRVATFYWVPYIHEKENKTFIVYVAADARLRNSATNERVKAKTQFSLVITHDYYEQNLSNYAYFNQQVENNTAPNNYIVNNYMAPTGEINLNLKYTKVKSVVGQEWTNTVYCFGFNPKTDLSSSKQMLKIKNEPDNNGGTAYIANYDDNSIILKGKTPFTGSTRIEITTIRKSDLKEVTASFEVRPQEFEIPEYPRIMYPEKAYAFDAKLSNELDSVDAYLKDGNKIRAEIHKSGTMFFTPTMNDTGKVLSFERYANGAKISINNIKVSAYRNPEVIRISKKDKDIAIAEIKTHGIYGGKENNVQKLIITGNATYKQLYGKTSNDEANLFWSEQFEIVPLDPSQPFQFRVIAVDMRGMASKEKSYPQ